MGDEKDEVNGYDLINEETITPAPPPPPQDDDDGE